MNAYVIHAVPTAPDAVFLAYVIPGVSTMERTATLVILRGGRDLEVQLPDGRRVTVKAPIASLALGPGVTVVLGDHPPLGVRIPDDTGEERHVGFAPPEAGQSAETG